MKRFHYKAKLRNGRSVSGIVESVDKQQAVALLREREMIVTKINESGGGLAQSLSFLVNRVPLTQLSTFTRQLATMISAGLNLVEALAILEGQNEGYFAGLIGDIRRSVEGGKSLAASLEAHGKVFDRVFVSLVRAGEKAGVLDQVLLRLADNLEKQREFRAKVKGAMIYPGIVMVVMTGAMIFTIVFVVPQMKEIYGEFDADLPAITQILIALSDFIRNYWYVVGVLVVGGIFGQRYAMKQKEIRKRWESFLFSLPVFGTLFEEILLTEITRTLSLLTHAGVPIVDALGLVAEGVDNITYREGVENSSSLVEKGFPLSAAFGQQESFPPLLSQMLAVGEETGKVDEIMMRVSQYFESESEEKVKNLSTAIEPVVLVIMAGGVGFLVFAIVIPIYNLSNTL